jgi:hypothetical protein
MWGNDDGLRRSLKRLFRSKPNSEEIQLRMATSVDLAPQANLIAIVCQLTSDKRSAVLLIRQPLIVT